MLRFTGKELRKEKEQKMMDRVSSIRNNKKIEDIGLIIGLVFVQFLYAANSVLLSFVLELGFKPSTLIIFSTSATFVVLAPISFVFERSKWPRSISCKLLVQLLLLSFGGVTVFQSLFMKGLYLTSPAIATAMPNIAPGLIFFIAWACRLERIELGCKYSRAKIAGTLLCISGAVVMSLMQSHNEAGKGNIKETKSTIQSQEADSSDISIFDKQTVIGCVYLVVAVLVLSSQIVLQAITLRDFPAPMSLCALTSLIGVMTTATVEFIGDRKRDFTAWPATTIREIIAYTILAGCISGMGTGFNAWAMKKRGPVMVSIFNPLGTVISVILSVVTLGESIGIGCLAGMCLMFTGLYFVLWAKGKEGFSVSDDGDDDDVDKDSVESQYDVEKPLLS